MTGRIFVIDKPERITSVVSFLERLRVEKPVQVVVSEWKPRRTDKANARLWLLYTLMAEHIRPEGLQFGKESWHEWAKRKFLTPIEIRLPNGRVIEDYPSTSEMTREDFSNFAMQVEEFANSRGVILPDIGD